MPTPSIPARTVGGGIKEFIPILAYPLRKKNGLFVEKSNRNRNGPVVPGPFALLTST
jgi:hypothetical protein